MDTTLSRMDIAFFEHTSIQRPHLVHNESRWTISGVKFCDSGLEHHVQCNGQPFKKTVVLIPVPSWMLNRWILNTIPLISSRPFLARIRASGDTIKLFSPNFKKLFFICFSVLHNLFISQAMTCFRSFTWISYHTCKVSNNNNNLMSQILELTNELQRTLGTTFVFITNSLPILARYADHILVLYAGTVAEYGTKKAIIQSPRHPYTQGLIESTPRLSGERVARLKTISGESPRLSKIELDRCIFADRCNEATERCLMERPVLTSVKGSDDHFSACFLASGTMVRV